MPLKPPPLTDSQSLGKPIGKPASSEAEEQDAHVGICPYYLRDRGDGVKYCEIARFRFHDKLDRREVVYRYCAHPEGYKACMLKNALDHYYERKYEKHE